MGIDPKHPAVQQAFAKGLIAGEGRPVFTKATAKKVKPRLVEPTFAAPNVFLVPCEVPSLANSREWRVRNQVAQAHRRAVSRLFGRHLAALVPFAEWVHSGHKLLVTLTRLGGHELDRFENLPASMKYILDGICLFLGVDDSDPRIVASAEQVPGGVLGVRIKLEMTANIYCKPPTTGSA